MSDFAAARDDAGYRYMEASTPHGPNAEAIVVQALARAFGTDAGYVEIVETRVYDGRFQCLARVAKPNTATEVTP